MAARWGCRVLAAVVAFGLALASAASPAMAQSTATYTYDALGRVITVSTAAGTTTYAYDGADNRTSYVAVSSSGNHAPIANNDGFSTPFFNVAAGASIVIPVLANDNDSDSDPMTVNSIVTNGAKGVASITAGAGSITYVANVGASGLDTFTYKTQDNHGGVSAVATVQVTIGTAPVAGPVTQHVAFNASATIALNVTGTYTSATVVTTPSHGSASGGSSITYTAGSGYTGTDSFTYSVTGAGGVSNTATISIIVDALPAPVVTNGSISTAYNTPGSTTLGVSGSYSSVSVVTQGSKGTASISGTTATYSPASGQTGPDSFTFVATGPGGTSNTGTVSVTIGAASTPLTAAASPSSYSRIRDLSGWGPATAVVVTPSGGNGVYAYSWAFVPGSGSSSFTIDNSSGNTVTWLKPGALTVGVFTATWRCTVTDTAGHSTTVDVGVEIEEEDGS